MGPNGGWKWGRGAPVVRPAPISDVGASGDGDVGAVAAGVAERRRGGIAGPARVPAVVGVGDGADIGRGVEEIIERRGIERRQRSFGRRSEEHTSELQSLMRISYAVFCMKKKKES